MRKAAAARSFSTVDFVFKRNFRANITILLKKDSMQVFP